MVFSKAGRDKGGAFIVLSVDGEYAYLTDGGSRPLTKPKKKKFKHIQPTKACIDYIKNKIINKLYLNDSDIRKALSPYSSNKEA